MSKKSADFRTHFLQSLTCSSRERRTVASHEKSLVDQMLVGSPWSCDDTTKSTLFGVFSKSQEEKTLRERSDNNVDAKVKTLVILLEANSMSNMLWYTHRHDRRNKRDWRRGRQTHFSRPGEDSSWVSVKRTPGKRGWHWNTVLTWREEGRNTRTAFDSAMKETPDSLCDWFKKTWVKSLSRTLHSILPCNVVVSKCWRTKKDVNKVMRVTLLPSSWSPWLFLSFLLLQPKSSYVSQSDTCFCNLWLPFSKQKQHWKDHRAMKEGPLMSFDSEADCRQNRKL